MKAADSPSSANLQQASALRGLLHSLATPWAFATRIWSVYGGVDGIYFELVAGLRESFEISTQTYAMYRLGRFVTDASISHHETFLLVASCGSTPVLRTWFATSRHGPFIGTIAATALASMFTVVLPFKVSVLYYALAPVATGYDPRFFVDRGNLFQQIFTLTWKDWCSTRLATLLAIASLETVTRKGEVAAGEARDRAASGSLR